MSSLSCSSCGAPMAVGSQFCAACGPMVESPPRLGEELPAPVAAEVSAGVVASPPSRGAIVGSLVLAAVAIVLSVIALARGDDGPAATSSVPAVETWPSTDPAESAVESETTAVGSTAATPSATTHVPSTEITTTEPPPATTPSGLPVVFPDTAPAEACTGEGIEAATGLVLAYEPWCAGAWALSQVEGTGGEEGADVFRWDGSTWWHRGYFYAMCDVGLTYAGMPPTIARAMFGGTGETCIPPVDLRPEPSSGPLQWGDEGSRVEALQRALIERNLLFDEADGQFGPNTEAAVRDLEYFLGLVVDGIADSAVFAELAP